MAILVRVMFPIRLHLSLPILLAALVALLAPTGAAQERPKSASELIRFLTYQAGRPSTLFSRGLFTCGSDRKEVQESVPAYEALVKLGPAALPAIEEALHAVELGGQESPFAVNSHWLLLAYARIKGPAAYPRLQGMLGEAKLDFLRFGLDGALALSLGLTSYVSSSRVPMRTFSCTGVLEPRHFLDQLILAWERHDREWTEASLGANARAALRSLLEEHPWEDLAAGSWRTESGGRLSIGYRFETSGWWSQEGEGDSIQLYAREPANPEIDTVFTGASGQECGRQKVKFIGTSGDLYGYRVDNTDLQELFRTLASCATDSSLLPR